MRPRILIAEPRDFSTKALKILATTADVTLMEVRRQELAAAMAEYDAILFRLGHHIDRELLAHAARTRILATPVTGLDHIDLQACQERGIRIVSLRGEVAFLEQVHATAELTLGLLLALVRRIPTARVHVLGGMWNRDRLVGSELFGKTAGIVGVGRLGRMVAGYLRALGMNVLGYDPREDFPADVQRVGSLEELVAESDVVSLHVSYDETTRHLVNQELLAKFKPGAVLINTSRGGVIDEAALLDALESGRIGGAALDVLSGEPYTTDHLLIDSYAHEHDGNLLITPHIGGNTREAREKTEVFLAGRVLEALKAL